MAFRRAPALAAIVIASGLLAAACDRESKDAPRKEALTPQFAPEVGDQAAGGGAAATPTSAGSAVPGDPVRAGSTTTAASGAAPTASTQETISGTTPAATDGAMDVPPTEAVISDRAGDVTPSLLDRAPAWADLLGARLVRSAAGFELRIRLGGGAAPAQAPDGDHTMNIASFYDVDGDGRIDYEVWLNVASGGWGSSYFDNTDDRKGGGFQGNSGVTITPEGDEIVARFPLSHVAAAERFRWSIASEWGRYETIGTTAAARDDVPDNDNAARFPGA
jgi:hypothetical protein